MESFYSVIYYKPNSMTDELLAIGLLCGGGEGPWFFASNKRLQLLKLNTHPKTFQSIKRNLKSFKEKVDHHRTNQSDLLLFDPYFSVEEMERIHKKLNGSLVYSQPTVVNEWMTENLFEDLVKSLLGEQKPSPSPKDGNENKWKTFVSKLSDEEWKKRFLINTILTAIIAPIYVDLYQESKKVVAQYVDFDKSSTSVLKRLQDLSMLYDLGEDEEIQYYVVYDVPKSQAAQKTLREMKKLLAHLNWCKRPSFKKIMEKV